MKKLLLISLLSTGLFANENVDKALEYVKKKEYKQARVLLEQESKKGDKKAQYELGNMYYYLDKKPKKAFELYEKSANQGYALAQIILGDKYFNQKEYKQALEWYKKAEKKNNKYAKYQIAPDFLIFPQKR